MSRRVHSSTKVAPSLDVVSTTAEKAAVASSASPMSSAGERRRLPLKPGDNVMAVWPGGNQWYNARVLNNIDNYEVEFGDKSKHVLDPQFVAAIAPPVVVVSEKNKPGRPKKRSTSPARVRVRKSRSKSPARQSNAKEKGPRKRSSSASRRVPANAAGDEADGSTLTTVTAAAASAVPPKSPNKRGRKKLVAVSPSPPFGSDGERAISAASSSTSQPLVVAATSSSTSSPSKGGVRQRAVGMTAKVAALQTARVAGVVTPGLITEGGIASDKPIARGLPTKVATTGHPLQRHFFGSFGAALLTFALPPLVVANYVFCNANRCAAFEPALPRRIGDYVDGWAIAIFFGWMSFQALLYALPIGRLVNGELLWDGTRLKYRMNGPFAFVSSLGAVVAALWYDGDIANKVLDRLLPIGITALAFSYILSMLLYARSRNVLACELNQQVARSEPKFFYDFFMGRELNPRPLGFELKLFLELRPGLIGWAALDVLILWKDYSSNGGQMSPSLIVSVVGQLLYVFDSLWFEDALLTTMDVTTEGLGFMLVFGDLVFVPAVFSVTSRFLLVERRVFPALSWYCLVAIVALFVFGYAIFRASNLQKDDFRREPFRLSHLETINTGGVKKILVDGWWRWVRHPNYLGDLLVALSFCLPAGFVSPIPYVYFVYLAVLLIHRARRDDDLCRQKYGAAWDEYTTRVRYRILKYVF